MTLTRTKKTMRVTAAPRIPDHRVPRKTLPNTQMFRVTALDASTVMPMSFFRTLSERGGRGNSHMTPAAGWPKGRYTKGGCVHRRLVQSVQVGRLGGGGQDPKYVADFTYGWCLNL